MADTKTPTPDTQNGEPGGASPPADVGGPTSTVSSSVSGSTSTSRPVTASVPKTPGADEHRPATVGATATGENASAAASDDVAAGARAASRRISEARDDQFGDSSGSSGKGATEKVKKKAAEAGATVREKTDRATAAAREKADRASAAARERMERAKTAASRATATARERMDHASATARERVDHAGESLREGYVKLRHEAETASADADVYVKENPARAIFVAAGVGFLLGLLFRSGKD